MELGSDRLKIYNIVKSGDNNLVQTTRYGPYDVMTDEELENLKKRIEKDKKIRQKQLDKQRDNRWSTTQLEEFYRNCSMVLKTRPICRYCNAIDYCRLFMELKKLVAFQERLVGSQELYEDYDRRKDILLKRTIGCSRARLGRHCKRRFNLFKFSPITEVDSVSFQPNISDYLVKET